MENSLINKISKDLDFAKSKLRFSQKTILNSKKFPEINLIYSFYDFEKGNITKEILEKYTSNYRILNLTSSSGYNEGEIKKIYGIDFDKINEEEKKIFNKKGFTLISISFKN